MRLTFVAFHLGQEIWTIFAFWLGLQVEYALRLPPSRLALQDSQRNFNKELKLATKHQTYRILVVVKLSLIANAPKFLPSLSSYYATFTCLVAAKFASTQCCYL